LHDLINITLMAPPAQYHVFSLPKELLDTLIPRNVEALLSNPETEEQESVHQQQPQLNAGPRSCNVCPGASFTDVGDQRSHYRSDWHRYNVKLRLSGANPVPAPEFDKLVDGA
jgi:hypothetical protein